MFTMLRGACSAPSKCWSITCCRADYDVICCCSPRSCIVLLVTRLIEHTSSDPQSSDPHLAPASLQLNAGLPMLWLTSLWAMHIHCCSSSPEPTCGGFFLQRSIEIAECLALNAWLVVQWHLVQVFCSPDKLSKVLCTVAAWIDSCHQIYLRLPHSRSCDGLHRQVSMCGCRVND